jgi:hypothetical protein
VVYHTSNFVHKTSDGGQNWMTISPDLTRNDKSHQGAFTGPGSEAEAYPTVSAFAESPAPGACSGRAATTAWFTSRAMVAFIGWM